MDSLQSTTSMIPFTSCRVGAEMIQTVNARDLHAFLGPKSRFNDWITRRIDNYGFQEGRDFTILKNENIKNQTLNERSDYTLEYHISLDMAKELSMVERTVKGKEARQYFLDCERRMNTPTLPTLHDPVSQALMHVLIENDATKHRLALLAQENIELRAND